MCEFTADIDGRKIVGLVKETREAQAVYHSAIRRGQTAFMVKEELADVFIVTNKHSFISFL